MVARQPLVEGVAQSGLSESTALPLAGFSIHVPI